MKLPVDTILEIIDRIEERDEYDFKAELENSPKGRADLVKDISSLANTGGGLLIYGVRNKKHEGIPSEGLKAYDPANLSNLIKDHLSPVPSITSEEISHLGLIFPVVKIAGAENTPIIVSKKISDAKSTLLIREGEIYVRQNTQTVLIQTEAQARKLIERFVESGINHQISKLFPILSKLAPISSSDGENQAESSAKNLASEVLKFDFSKSHREVSLTIGSGCGVSRDKVKENLRIFADLNGWTFPHKPREMGSTHEKKTLDNGFVVVHGTPDELTKSIFRITDTGDWFWLGPLYEDLQAALKDMVSGTGKFEDSIGIIVTLVHVVLVLQYSREFLKKTGILTACKLQLRWRNVSGRRLIMDDSNRILVRNLSVADSTVSAQCQIDQNMQDEDLKRLASRVILELLEKFGWDNPNEMQLYADIEKFSQKVRFLEYSF